MASWERPPIPTRPPARENWEVRELPPRGGGPGSPSPPQNGFDSHPPQNLPRRPEFPPGPPPPPPPPMHRGPPGLPPPPMMMMDGGFGPPPRGRGFPSGAPPPMGPPMDGATREFASLSAPQRGLNRSFAPIGPYGQDRRGKRRRSISPGFGFDPFPPPPPPPPGSGFGPRFDGPCSLASLRPRKSRGPKRSACRGQTIEDPTFTACQALQSRGARAGFI